ncbi:MAG: hypothetical protein JRI23_28110 [Deltaproteobacteria bacterium]|nr:hypothetical protein [Deltaproteobacteria bacterium]MBW2535956.1 hypothetical protein [Deltaproteobacteria bacterium]
MISPSPRAPRPVGAVRLAGWALAALILATATTAAGQGRFVCIRAWKEAPYRSYGYDHIVAVQNGCAERLRCTVSTSVSPQRYAVAVGPQRTARVLTFRGAPTREFSARVECRAAE